MSDEETFADAAQGANRDSAKEAKRVRGNKKAGFTKRFNGFKERVEAKVHESQIKASYDALKQALDVLENAHEDYVDLVGDDVIKAEENYLKEPAKQMLEADVMYDQIMAREGFEAAKGKVMRGMQAFESSCDILTQLSSEKSISFTDMRKEIARIEAQYVELKTEEAEVVAKFPSADVNELTDKFKELVGDKYQKCKATALRYLQTDVTEESTSRSRYAYSATKRETVMLPKFSGDEKTAYLKYSVWRKQWESHIVDYEEKHRATMLLSHLDNKAQERIVGLENEYDRAMAALDRYYNNSSKIIEACMKEINALPNIMPGDYEALVTYKTCIVNNHTRLKAAGLEHEVSNAATMKMLVSKLPWTQVEKWSEYLEEQDEETQVKEFELFLTWLEKVGRSWEKVVASGVGRKGSSKSTTESCSFHADVKDG